jgi:hypothetical protein
MKVKDFYNSTAWKYCSKYVLLYYSNNEGDVQCSTSGRWYACNDRKIHCGHYHKLDSHKATAFEFTNLAPQCYTDNKYFSGKPDVMREWLIKQHGIKAIQRLDIQKHNICKIGKFELDLFKEHYKKLFNDLVRKKGFNPWK